jgi:hypothetical protein
MAFTTSVVTAVQGRIAPMALSTLTTYLQAIGVANGTVVNNAGVVTVGGVALTNSQYEQLYEMLF